MLCTQPLPKVPLYASLVVLPQKLYQFTSDFTVHALLPLQPPMVQLVPQ